MPCNAWFASPTMIEVPFGSSGVALMRVGPCTKVCGVVVGTGFCLSGSGCCCGFRLSGSGCCCLAAA